MFPLDPSDIALIVDFFLAAALALVFAIGRPRTWHRDPLGWVIFYYALATVALLFLIVWGIVAGQKVDEWARFLISTALAVALVWKIVAVVRERHKGRIAGQRIERK